MESFFRPYLVDSLAVLSARSLGGDCISCFVIRGCHDFDLFTKSMHQEHSLCGHDSPPWEGTIPWCIDPSSCGRACLEGGRDYGVTSPHLQVDACRRDIDVAYPDDDVFSSCYSASVALFVDAMSVD